MDNNRERFLSKSEIKILLDKVKDNHQAYLFTILSLSTGARIQTTCAIQQKHIKLESNSILLKDIKNKKTYTGFIKQEFIPYIEQSIQNLDPNDFVLGNGDIVKQVQRKMRPILNNLFNNKLEKDDRKNRVVIHTLRHTFASQLISNNAPIFTVKKLMHHADIKTTMRYVSVDNNFGQNFVDNIF
ncbi:site-specific integrase [Sulfurospirillum diekertiae]|uniref:site-specific integrase n=1 Tax=Sulfurospirillum diekertiae TaxID=1854492 RepID=UPI000B4D65D1